MCLAQPLALTLDLNVEPSEYILFDGSLTDVPLGRLAPGSHAKAELAQFRVPGFQNDLSSNATSCVRISMLSGNVPIAINGIDASHTHPFTKGTLFR